jgi:adenylate cyclase
LEKAEHIRIYEPLALATEQTQLQAASAAAYAEGLARWRAKDFAGAVESFGCFADCDPPARLFRERARKLVSDRLPDNWLPVNVLETK